VRWIILWLSPCSVWMTQDTRLWRFRMPANTPQDICRLFKHAMADGDLESVLSLYDAEAVFVNQIRRRDERQT
jgi:hypothetical protein